MAILFDIVYVFALLIYLPILAKKKRLHSGYWERLGRIPKETQDRLAQGSNVWIHAVSVGEVLAVADLIDKLQERFSDKQIVCSVVTETGYAIAHEKLPKSVCIIFAPLDFSWVVRKYIRLVNPIVYIFAETEIWPNLVYKLHRQGVGMIQVNGRISDGSYKGYQRLRMMTRSVLPKVDRFLMQSQTDADRIISLGAREDSVQVMGNLKFDSLPEDISLDMKSYGLTDSDELLIAGSTHPGEEEILHEVYQQLKPDNPTMRLIICPRNVKRCEEIMTMLMQKSQKAVRLSEAQKQSVGADEVIVVDTMGQLRNLYSLAKVVFIGKTFTVHGGQNMIEPGYFAKPIIVGPFTENFKDVMTIFLREKAIVQVPEVSELAGEIDDIWNNAIRRESLGMAAKRVVVRYQGATAKTVQEIAAMNMRN